MTSPDGKPNEIMRYFQPAVIWSSGCNKRIHVTSLSSSINISFEDLLLSQTQVSLPMASAVFPCSLPTGNSPDTEASVTTSTFPAEMFAALVAGNGETPVKDVPTGNAPITHLFTFQSSPPSNFETAKQSGNGLVMPEPVAEDVSSQEKQEAAEPIPVPIIHPPTVLGASVSSLPAITVAVTSTQPKTAAVRTALESAGKTELPTAPAPPTAAEVVETGTEVAFAALVRQTHEQAVPDKTSEPHPKEQTQAITEDKHEQSLAPKLPAKAVSPSTPVPPSASDCLAPSTTQPASEPLPEQTPSAKNSIPVHTENESTILTPPPALAVFTPPSAKAAPPTPVNPMAEVVVIPTPAIEAPRPVNQLSLRVESETAQTADIRMIEQNGEVKVIVRASDPVLANTLRSDLSDLTSRLAHRDLAAEIWHPLLSASSAQSSNSSSNQGGHQEERSNPSPFMQPKQDDRQQHSGREQRNAPSWLDDFEQASAQRPQRKEGK